MLHDVRTLKFHGFASYSLVTLHCDLKTLESQRHTRLYRLIPPLDNVKRYGSEIQKVKIIENSLFSKAGNLFAVFSSYYTSLGLSHTRYIRTNGALRG